MLRYIINSYVSVGCQRMFRNMFCTVRIFIPLKYCIFKYFYIAATLPVTTINIVNYRQPLVYTIETISNEKPHYSEEVYEFRT